MKKFGTLGQWKVLAGVVCGGLLIVPVATHFNKVQTGKAARILLASADRAKKNAQKISNKSASKVLEQGASVFQGMAQDISLIGKLSENFKFLANAIPELLNLNSADGRKFVQNVTDRQQCTADIIQHTGPELGVGFVALNDDYHLMLIIPKSCKPIEERVLRDLPKPVPAKLNLL